MTKKLISWNVNGIRAVLKRGQLQELIEKEKPDYLCLQEIKAEETQVDDELSEYEQIWNSSQTKKGYSGTLILSKEKPLNFSKNLEENGYDLSDKFGNTNNEGRVITAEFENFYLVTVYTPNSKGDLSRLSLREKEWDPAFLKHVKNLEEKKPVIFCGDLNVAHKPIDLARPKGNERSHGFTIEERRGFDNIVNSGFLDTFRMFEKDGGFYTWWSPFAKSRERNVGWRIDYFVASGSLKDKIQNAWIDMDFMGSDHCPIGLEINI